MKTHIFPLLAAFSISASSVSHADEIYMTCPGFGQQYIFGFDSNYKSIWSRFGTFVVFHKYKEQKNSDLLPLVVYFDEQKKNLYAADFRKKTITNLDLVNSEPIYCR